MIDYNIWQPAELVLPVNDSNFQFLEFVGALFIVYPFSSLSTTQKHRLYIIQSNERYLWFYLTKFMDKADIVFGNMIVVQELQYLFSCVIH